MRLQYALKAALSTLAISSSLGGVILAQQIKPATNCPGQQCSTVRIDSVSHFGKDMKGILYITVTGNKGTYILSCVDMFDDQSCLSPVVGRVYEYYEKNDRDNSSNRTSFLQGPNTTRGEYVLEVYVPQTSGTEVLQLIQECEAKDRWIDVKDCAFWLRRKLSIEKEACPDPEAQTACQSFQDLLAARDTDVMDDLAVRAHVFVCFVPQKDEFFEITFDNPGDSVWSKPSSEDQSQGIRSDAVVALGVAELAYYRNGVGDGDRSYHNNAMWVYYPLGQPTDPISLQKQATINTSTFKGKEISIEDNRFEFSDTYKDQAGTQTTHSITVQLSTGRYTEKYEHANSGETFLERSGRCLIVPNDKF